MAKIKLNDMTLEQLESYKVQLIQEIDSLTKIIEASDTTVFDLLINEVKEEMSCNIAEEEWKILKENQKKVESYCSIEKALQNQEDLLARKHDELADVEDKLKYYQLQMFKPEETGFEHDYGDQLYTGDVYKKVVETGEISYYAIKKSAEKAEYYAIISNEFEGERLLQYPSNRAILDEAHYVGNIYVDDAHCDAAKSALVVIADSQQKGADGDGGKEEETEDDTCAGA